MDKLYTVVIVDDEATISEGLSRLVKWNDVGFNVIATFSNGRDASEFLKVNHADVILTDIKMPHMTGIELAKWIYENNINTKVVFLTGYKDFEYAKKAVEYNVNFYLLKPTQLSELYETFGKVKDILDKERTQTNKIDNIKHLMRDQFFTNLYFGAVNRSEDIEKMVAALHGEFDFNENRYAVIKLEILQYDDYLKTISKYGAEQIYDVIYNWFSLKYKNIGYIPVYSFKQYIIYIAYAKDGLEEMIESTDDIKNEIYDIFNLNLKVNSSRVYNSVYEISQNKGITSIPRNNGEASADLEQFFEQQKILVSNIFSHDEHLAITLYESIVDELSAFDFEVQKNYVEYIFSNIYKKFMSLNLHMDSEISVLQKVAVKSVGTSEELLEWGKEIIRKLIENIRGNYEFSENSVINKAKEYINNHYNEDITLSGVANYVFLSSAYFSRLFKKYCNENFSDYLMRVRITKSAYLLENTSMKVYEVAERVGFKTLKYFYKNFKEYMGVSPSEYRISILNTRSGSDNE